MDTLGVIKCVLIREVSSFQRAYTYMLTIYEVGTEMHYVPVRETKEGPFQGEYGSSRP